MYIFIRHSDDESDGCSQDHDCQLARYGKHLATKVGKKLIRKYGVPNVIYVSPFRRTLQTMEYMLYDVDRTDIKIIEDVRISRYFSSSDKRNPKLDKQTKKKNVPIYESYSEFKSRVDDFIEDLNDDDKLVWVITHVVVYKRLCRYFDKHINGHVPFMHHTKFEYCDDCKEYHSF